MQASAIWQFYLSISPLVGEECLDHFLDGHVELEAEVFLDGSMESISDIFLDPTLILSEWDTFLPTGDILSSLSLSPSISSSANTSCLITNKNWISECHYLFGLLSQSKSKSPSPKFKSKIQFQMTWTWSDTILLFKIQVQNFNQDCDKVEFNSDSLLFSEWRQMKD